MPLVPQVALQAFDKWAVDFVGHINSTRKITGERYIITVTDYLTRCAEAALVKDCTAATTAKLMFDNVILNLYAQRF